MKIYYSLKDFIPNGKAVVTTGTFDGVHVGHQEIIKRLIETSKNTGGESVILTFWPHPRMVISPSSGDELRLLSTIEEKIEELEKLGVNHLIILPFTRAFSELTSERFIEDILIEGLGTHKLVLGYDHRFGKNREGGIDYLTRHAHRFKIDIEEIPRQEIDNLTISSTKIRQAILTGEVKTASELLGRPYSFTGHVVKGRQLGRTIGFPTANILVSESLKLIPKNGVYLVKVFFRNQEFHGIMNIGNRPTVDGNGITQEVFIFDFDDDIYGETLKVEMMSYIREEKKFESIDALISQINKDCEDAKKLINENC